MDDSRPRIGERFPLQMDGALEASDESTEKRGGLEPEEHRRRLILVTLLVLGLGVAGGTCLGYKIQRAERLQKERNEEQLEQGRPGEDRPSIPERRAR